MGFVKICVFYKKIRQKIKNIFTKLAFLNYKKYLAEKNIIMYNKLL